MASTRVSTDVFAPHVPSEGGGVVECHEHILDEWRRIHSAVSLEEWKVNGEPFEPVASNLLLLAYDRVTIPLQSNDNRRKIRTLAHFCVVDGLVPMIEWSDGSLYSTGGMFFYPNGGEDEQHRKWYDYVKGIHEKLGWDKEKDDEKEDVVWNGREGKLDVGRLRFAFREELFRAHLRVRSAAERMSFDFVATPSKNWMESSAAYVGKRIGKKRPSNASVTSSEGVVSRTYKKNILDKYRSATSSARAYVSPSVLRVQATVSLNAGRECDAGSIAHGTRRAWGRLVAEHPATGAHLRAVPGEGAEAYKKALQLAMYDGSDSDPPAIVSGTSKIRTPRKNRQLLQRAHRRAEMGQDEETYLLTPDDEKPSPVVKTVCICEDAPQRWDVHFQAPPVGDAFLEALRNALCRAPPPGRARPSTCHYPRWGRRRRSTPPAPTVRG